jgi:hypothetical protein
MRRSSVALALGLAVLFANLPGAAAASLLRATYDGFIAREFIDGVEETDEFIFCCRAVQAVFLYDPDTMQRAQFTGEDRLQAGPFFGGLPAGVHSASLRVLGTDLDGTDVVPSITGPSSMQVLSFNVGVIDHRAEAESVSADGRTVVRTSISGGFGGPDIPFGVLEEFGPVRLGPIGPGGDFNRGFGTFDTRTVVNGVTVASYGGSVSFERLIVERVPDPAAIPLPAGAWLMLTALAGVAALRRAGRSARRA